MAEIQTYLYGKKFPNRIFVGGLPLNTNAYELASFFNFFGHVTESKIILDESGLSKGYGFVTFEQKSSVTKVESMGIIYFKNKKINIGPAVKKEATVVQPEIVMWPQSYPVTSATATNVIGQQLSQPYYNNFQGYSRQSFGTEPFVTSADSYQTCYQVTNDGTYWMAYPTIVTYNPDITRNIPQVAFLQRPVFRSNSSSSSASSGDEEVRVVKKHYSAKRKELPPRFMKK